MDFEFDAAAVAGQYGSDAQRYAELFAGNERDVVDLAVLDGALGKVPVGGLVLDAGCGPGQGAEFAEQLGRRGIGLDLTFEMLTIARRRVRAPFVQGDLRALPFASGSFDAVIAWFSLLHLPGSALPAACADIRRVMRPGGPLVVAWQASVAPGADPESKWTPLDAEGVERLLMEAGFRDVTTRTRPPRPEEYQATKVLASAVRP